jgi:hypothetical protein
MLKIMGVDPGIRGGMAIISTENGGSVMLIDAIDVPTMGTGAKERIDALAVGKWIETHRPDHCFFERAGSMPKQGVASTFKYARAVGSLETAVLLSGVPLTIIEPAVWKRFYKLVKDKEQSRLRALMLFPASHDLFARRKDHQRAEAALLANYGLRDFRLTAAAPPGADTGLANENLMSGKI